VAQLASIIFPAHAILVSDSTPITLHASNEPNPFVDSGLITFML
jgi:hypothetical protein